MRRLVHHWPVCRKCGSSLAGRLERTRWSSKGRARFEVEIFRCPCGTRRLIRREAAAR